MVKLVPVLIFVTLVVGCTAAPGSFISQTPTAPSPIPTQARPTPTVSPVPTPTPSPSPNVAKPTPTPPGPTETPVQRPTPVVENNGVLLFDVPFASQAPYALWDDLHNEACEEAAMIMVNAYFNNRALNAHVMEQGILNLVKWEGEHGYTVDVTVAEAVNILNDYFHLTARIVANPTTQAIRDELSAGRLVIVPAAGRMLGNPNFRQPGPIYHMLVIRGYDANTDEFITNDPGTRKGEGYRYDSAVLIAAIHDWPKLGKANTEVSDAEMNAGNPVMIVVPGE